MSMYVCLKPTKPLGFAGVKFLWKSIQNLTFNSIFFELWGGVLLDAQLGCKSVCMYVWTPAHYVYVCMFGPSSTSACMQWLSIYVCMFETLIRVCMYVRRNPRAWLCMYVWLRIPPDKMYCVCMFQVTKHLCMYVSNIHTHKLRTRLLSLKAASRKAFEHVCMYVRSPQACMYVCLKPSSVYVCMFEALKRVCMYASNIQYVTYIQSRDASVKSFVC